MLERLVILAFATPDYSGPPVGAFEAYVNPAELTLGYELEWDGAQGAGTTGARMNFKALKPGDLQLSFFLDGTGASGRPLNVQLAVEQFQQVTGYSGKIHRPHYLKIAWGTLQVRRCVLKSASVTYRLFEPDGVPLRAVISATFIETTDDRSRVALAGDQSADLSHVRVVAAGDTLPGLCRQVYGDPRRYLDVAEENGLDTVRTLVPGTRLHFRALED